MNDSFAVDDKSRLVPTILKPYTLTKQINLSNDLPRANPLKKLECFISPILTLAIMSKAFLPDSVVKPLVCQIVKNDV